MARRIADIADGPDSQPDIDLRTLPGEVPFAVRRRREGTALVVEVSGEIDLATADHVRDAAADGAADRVVLDLRDVGFMDTSGIRLVVELMRGEEADGPPLWIVAAHDPVLRLLAMAGLTSRLRIVPTVGEALR